MRNRCSEEELSPVSTRGQGRTFTLNIHDEGDGMLWAEVQELPGCFASGTDLDELKEAAVEAIHMWLGDPISLVPAETSSGSSAPPSEDPQAKRLVLCG